MNIKIILVKYFDWVILVILGALLLYAMFQAFLVEDTTVAKLSDDIERAKDQVELGMREEKAEPVEVPDYLGRLKNRYERLPVMSPYTVNPFKLRTVIPGDPILLAKGQTKVIIFKGIRIVQVMPYNKVYLDVAVEYDPEITNTVAKIHARAKSDSFVKLRDDRDTIYVRRVIIREKPPLPEPRPLIGTVVQTYRPEEDTAGKRQPAKVFLAGAPDNPETPQPGWGLTTHVEISRKPAGASDEDYVLITDGPLAPLTAEKVRELRLEFLAEGAAEDADEARGESRDRTRQPRVSPGRSMEAPEAEDWEADVRRARRTKAKSREREDREQVGPLSLDALLRAKNFAFVDRTVDDGESYTYKIVTVAKGEGVPLKRCSLPYITPTPVEVPSLVEFDLTRVSAGSAGFQVTRPRPDTGQMISKDFRIEVGMGIGVPIRIKEKRAALDRRLGSKYKFTDVDFSTNCVFVIGLPGIKRVEYSRISYDKKTDGIKYRLRLRPAARAAYLTARGSLRWKLKGELARKGAREEDREDLDEPERRRGRRRGREAPPEEDMP